MAKAANGSGSLYKVDTISGPRWQYSETVGKDANGKLIRVTGTGKTQADARRRQKDNQKRYWLKVNEIDLPASAKGKGLRHSDINLSVAKMCYEWLDSIDDTVLEASTRRGYLHRIELHLAPPPFGNLPIKALTPKQVRQHFQVTLPAKKKTTGPGKGEEQLLGKKALGNVWSAFSSAINWALEEGLLDKDPRTKSAKPRLSSAETMAEYRKQAEYAKTNWKPAKVLEYLEGREDEAQWLIQFILACRQSEKLGLKWDSFNNLFSHDKNRKVTVRFEQQLARKQVFHGCGNRHTRTLNFPCGQRNANNCSSPEGKSGYEIKLSTKTLGGMREVPVPDFLAEVLRQHKKRQDEWKKSENWKPLEGLENLVFTTKLGTPLRHQQDTKDWRRICEKLNLGDLRGHTARHFAATTMAARGVPLTTIGAIIGHASEQITRLIYTHPDNDAMAEALAVMDTKYRPKKKTMY
jgi:integrase